MDLYFSPQEKWLASWVMLVWISFHSSSFLVHYMRNSVQKAEFRRHQRRRSSRAMPPQNWRMEA